MNQLRSDYPLQCNQPDQCILMLAE